MHATVRTTHSPRTLRLRHSPLALALAACLSAAPVAGLAQVAANQLPTGGSIAGGTGTINAASGASQVITQTSNRMALNWSTFDIGSAATVTFNQPSSSAAVLNLVQGGNPTQIFGNLNANGQVFLINTNGMIFGSTAQINVGGLVASTLGTTASGFMSGNDVLDAGGNTVALMSNSGTINAAAGAVNLIGGKVVNSGTITASAGNINLVGADKVTLTFESGGFGVVVDKALQLQLDALAVDNSGTLSAPGGVITLQARAAQGMFDQLINNSGVIRAAAISSGSDGSVSLVANGAGQTGIGGTGSIDVGSGAISISTERSVQQSGIYTAGTVTGSIGGNASFTGNNRIAELGTLDVGGNLSLSNAIDLTQSGALTVGGTSNFSLGSHALTLTDGGNDFGQAVSLASGTTAITDSGALTLGTLTTGNLTATSSGALNLGRGTVTGTLAATSNGGAISQSASNPLTVTSTSNLNAGAGSITLQQTGNDFGSAVSLTGAGIALTDSNALTIAALNLGSNSALSLDAAGTLTLPTSAIATGVANLSLRSGNALTTAAALSGANVSLRGDAGITLAHTVSATGTLGLTTSNSAIVQSAGVLAVSGTSVVNTGSGTIALTGAGNHFGQAVSLTGGSTAITDSGALTLGTLATGNLTAISSGALNLGRGTVTGTLSATSNGGAISQSASNPLTVTGTSNLNAGAGAITLTTSGNDFGQAVSLTAGTTVITDANALTLGTVATGNLTATSTGALNLGRGTVTGTLAATSNGGAITQSGSNPLTVTGTSTLNAGTGAITLTTSGNDFGQAVSLTSGSTAITDANALTLGTLATGNLTAISSGALNLGSGTVTGTLQATSNGGAIGQSTIGPLSVTGTSALDAGSGAITLTTSGNDFGQAVSLTGSSAAITDANALTLGALATGNLTAISSGALNLGSGTVTGALSATSNGGAITQSASNPFTVTGTSNLNAGTGAITLTNAGNDFRQALTLISGNAAITDANALTFDALTTGGLTAISSGALDLGRGTVTGALSATSNGGAISQSTTNPLTVTGTSSLNAGAGAITLEQAGNDFGGAVSLTGSGIRLVDGNDLTVAALTLGSNSALSLNAAGTLILPANAIDTGSADLSLRSGTALTTAAALSGTNVSLRGDNGITLAHNVSAVGTLGLTTSNSAIVQSAGALAVSGTSSVNAGSGAIALTGAGNHFGQAVGLTGGTTQITDSGALTLGTLVTGNLTAISSGALNLGSGTVTGTLSATSNGGAIGQSASNPLTVTGASNLNAGAGAITLATSGNDFGQAVSLTGGTTAITDSGALTLGTLATGNLTAISSGALNLGSGTVTGTLSATSNGGAITQSASNPLTVTGTSNLNAGTGAITLTTGGNDFQSALSLNGTGIQVRDSNALAISALTSNNNGNVVLIAGGALTLPAQELNNGSGDITLSANGTLNTGGALRGDEVTLFARDGLGLGHDIAARTLALTSTNAAINQSAGTLAITGATSVDAGAGSIALLNTGNDFNTLSLTGSGIAVYDQNALNISALTSNGNGNVVLTAGGALSLPAQSIALGSGNLSLTANGGALSTAGNLSGNSISLTGRDGLTLGNNITANTLSLSSSNAAINQTAGALAVAAATTVNAGTGSIALNNASNRFGTGISLTGTGIAVSDSSDLTITALNAGTNGSIALTAGGALNLSAQNIDTGSGNLTLIANGGGLSTGGTLSGRNVALTARDGLGLGHSITTAETLSLTSNNTAITQTAGALNVGTTTTLNAGTGSIALNNSANTFAGAVNLTGGDVQIAANALTLGTLSTNALTASSNGALNLGSGNVRGTLTGTSGNAAITQTGALSVGGVSDLNAGSGAITLANINNDFINAVSVTGGNVAIADRNALTLGNVSAGALTASSVGALNLGSGTIGGTLTATSNNGAINQSGRLTVVGTSVLNAGSGSITLTDANNALQGAVELVGAATQLRNNTALMLGSIDTGALDVGSNGALNLGSGRATSLIATSNGNAITQAGALAIAGSSRLDAGTNSITLINAGNDFAGGVSLIGGATQLVDSNTLTLNTLSTGALNLASGGALTLGTGTVDGALTASSNGGAINQSGALTVTGTSVLNAGSGSITLTHANNTLQGQVDLVGAATQLRNNRALTLGSIDTGALDVGSNGALNLGRGRTASLIATSNGNAITQAGALAIAGSSRLDAGMNSITLTNAGNDFVGAVSLIGGATQLVDSNALTLSTLNTGALTLASGGALTLSTGTVDGTLIADANGAISQTDALTVTGTSSFAAGNNAITLNNAGNDFRDAVSLNGGMAEIVDRNDLALGTVATAGLNATSTGALNLGSGTINGALSAQSTNGALTQGGVLSVAGTSILNVGTGSIALNNSANTFAGAVNLTGGDVQIAANALTLGALSTNALTANSNGALNLGSGNVRGTLTGTSGNAAITQTGALSVGGASSFNAGSGNIVLTDANNDFVGALALAGNAIAVQDRNDLSIAALQSGANAAVSLVAGGGLNLPVGQIDTGDGVLTLTANGGSLRSNGTLRGGDVQLTGANGIELTNGLTATNTLSLSSSNAAITQSGGVLRVAGNTTVNAGNGAITLDTAGNDFQGVLALSGGTSTVRDANALTLGALNTGSLQVTNNGALNLGVGLVNGDLVATSNGGAVAQSGALTVTGSTRINSGGAAIALNNADNDFQAAVSLSGGNTSVRDRNALTLGSVDVGALDVASGAALDLGQGRIGGALLARSGGAASASPNALVAQALVVPAATAAGITQQGALTVVGSSVLDAGNAAIVLTDAGNDFQGNVQARGSSIAIVDRNDLAATAQASDALRLQAGGQLATAGTLSAADIALRGGTGIVLGHDVGGASVALTSGGAITQNAGSLRAGRLSGAAAGAVTLTGSNNAIDVLGDFSAQGLDLVSNRTLLVSGRVDGGPSLRLRSGGELQLSGQLSGATSWLQAVAGIRQRAGSVIAADLLSGSAGGPVVLGDSTSFIDNRVVRLGDFTASNGFSFTNGGDLLLVLANGSSNSVDAGNSAMFLSVRGDLLQDGRAPLRNGTGTFAATGRIGTQQNPIYVIGSGTQTVAAVGAPPAYFNATTADGGLLDLAGGSGFNVPTSAFASRAQSSASRTVAFVDLSASGTPYRAFGLVRPGLRLPDDQQPACDAGDPDAVCSPE